MLETLKQSSFKTKITATILLLIVLVLTALQTTRVNTIDLVFSPIDERAKEYLEDSLKKAALTYAGTRVVHAGVALIKGTEINPPFATVSVGEILSPLSDLLERLSNLLLIAIASIGAQRIFLEITHSVAIAIFVPAGVFLMALSLWVQVWQKEIFAWGFRLVIIGFIFRLAVPIMAFSASLAHDYFLQKEYQKSSSVLLVAEASVQEAATDQGKKSWYESAKEWTNTSEITKKFSALKERAEELSFALITLFSIFVFETIIFPIFSLWILLKLLNITVFKS